MGYLNDYPLLLIFVVSLIVMLGASEIGRWRGVRARGKGEENVSTLEGALFGLLGLMIGFTFAMALTRFEARRDAVLNEANAIGRTAFRLRLLPAPYSTEALNSLQKYAQLRVTIAQHTPTLKELNEDIARSNEFQEQLWQQAMEGAPKANPWVPPLVFDTLNGLFDSQRKRLALLANQVPNEVLLMLYGIAAVAIAFAGYAQGLRTRPSRLMVYLMGVVVCVVIILIDDIETQNTGFISVSQQPLIDAAAGIAGTR